MNFFHFLVTLSCVCATSVEGTNTRALKAPKTPKASKSPKQPKQPKSPKSNLIALIEPVDGSDAIGTTTISYNADGSFLFALDMNGLASDGTAVIANTCETDEEYGVGWDGYVNFYNALDEGISKSAFRHNNGHSAGENLGKTVIIYDDTDTIVGCGTLGFEAKKKVLEANMGTYPGYTGDIVATGKVTVSFHTSGDSFKFQYDLSGLEADCVNCGIHIHAGTSCATNELVLGHGWNSVVVQDLWTTDGGAFYNTDKDGKSKGFFQMYNGFGYEENYHHAVVIHGQDGSRLGCGILM